MKRILVVDDEERIRTTLSNILTREGYGVVSCGEGEVALSMIEKEEVDLVLLDVRLPGMDGIEVLERIAKIEDSPVVIMISAHGTVEMAVRATKLGAYDFIEKPFDLDKMLITIQRAIDYQRINRENIELRKRVGWEDKIIGESKGMKRVFGEVDRASPTNGRVLIYGENGTGKEVIARAIHLRSKRKDGPFVKVNCAAIPHELIESELFGHEKGAFTGAISSKKGKFELANGGTLFLDEIGDMSLPTQAKVLRAIETGEVERVGAQRSIKVDTRIISATNKDLKKEISNGRFREDLYYRLNVIPINLPPLRERREDIPLLIDHFLKGLSSEYGKPPKTLTHEAISLLKEYRWPGNVRELRNFVERMVIMVEKTVIDKDDLYGLLPIEDMEEGMEGIKEAVRRFEKNYILKILKENDGNITKAAHQLGIERSHLHKKLKVYGIK
jgi:two-component system nitrogen regulation response regulator NtrX